MNRIKAIEVEVSTIPAVGRFGPLYKEKNRQEDLNENTLF